jgi:hypothetical protein
MPIASLFQWIRDTSLATAVRESAIAYPIIMSLHLTSIAVFGGMILMTDLRLLGVAMRSVPVAEVIRQFRWWKRAGFVVMVTCGALLAASKADQYYINPYFQIKMALLVLVGVHALVFRRGVYGNPGEPDRVTAKIAGWLSLALWLGIMTAGRWIAYYETPRETVRVESKRIASAVVAARVNDPTVTWATTAGRKAGVVSASSNRMTKTAMPSDNCNSTIPSSAPAAVRSGEGCGKRCNTIVQIASSRPATSMAPVICGMTPIALWR